MLRQLLDSNRRHIEEVNKKQAEENRRHSEEVNKKQAEENRRHIEEVNKIQAEENRRHIEEANKRLTSEIVQGVGEKLAIIDQRISALEEGQQVISKQVMEQEESLHPLNCGSAGIENNQQQQQQYQYRDSEEQEQERAQVPLSYNAMKGSWIDGTMVMQKATELQNLSDARNLRGFYAGIKELYGPIRSSSGALKAADNSTILTESQDILNRWKEYFSSLLKSPSTAAGDFLKNAPQHPPKSWLADPPTFQEFCKALKSVKPGKAPGPDSIPMELIEGGGLPLKTRLFSLIILM
ncbi:caldesmon-like [Schistocerca piceifrons]|uniref:caldesmon-like n=1 Tax=Schistocerca piceifrons TaxID=274613 RepID=UPI001F5EF339|nr:caldesmon-like [Schistocerca piceifrons]